MLRYTSLIISSLAISCGAAIADPVAPASETVTATNVEVPMPPPRPTAKRSPVAQKVVRAAPTTAPAPERLISHRAIQFPSVGHGI